MEKWVYDVMFKKCDFEVSLDRCFAIAMCEVMDMVDNRIEKIKFKNKFKYNLDDGFIPFDTTEIGVFHHRIRFA